jgi:CheY-like chemotaxis protein
MRSWWWKTLKVSCIGSAMDILKPRLLENGEAPAKIREKEKLAGMHQPVVALTAHAMKGDQELCLAAGADGYVTKAICPQELDGLLERYTRAATATAVPVRAES